MEQIRRIMRPTDVPDQGLLCDLLWSDPDKDTMGWGENDRGVSFTFGAEVSSQLPRFGPAHDPPPSRPLDCRKVLGQARFRSDLPRASSRRGWLRVLRQTPAGHTLLSAQLLWRIRQRR